MYFLSHTLSGTRVCVELGVEEGERDVREGRQGGGLLCSGLKILGVEEGTQHEVGCGQQVRRRILTVMYSKRNLVSEGNTSVFKKKGP